MGARITEQEMVFPFFPGSAGTIAGRPRYHGVVAHGRGGKHPDRAQPLVGRLYGIFPVYGKRA